MQQWRLGAVALTATVLLGVTGVTAGVTASAKTPTRGGTLRILSVEPAGSLEPTTSFADSARLPLAMMFETLIERDTKGKLIPALAQRWEAKNAGASYVFYLRPGIKFSNGQPVTASDVKFSIDRMRSQGFTLKRALSGVTNVSIINGRTVRVDLKSPSRVLPQALARAGHAVILPMKAVLADKDFFTKLKPSSGPWQLAKWTPKQGMTLIINPYYHKKPFISKIEYIFGADQTTAAAAVESGSVDFAYVSYADAARLRREGKVKVLEADMLTPLFFGFNKTKPPFSDLRVRQAFAYAVDRVGKQQACWYGTGEVTYGSLLRPWDPNYVKIDTFKLARPTALKKAAALLDAAGWIVGPNGKRVAKGVTGVADDTPLEVTVPYESNWPAAECHTLILQSNLRDVGVRVVPESYDWTVFWTDVGAGKFAMWHGGAGAVDAEDLYLNWFRSGGALTGVTTQLTNPDIDRLVDTLLSTNNPKSARGIIRFLERWQAANQPMLADGYQWVQLAVTKRLQGYVRSLDHIDSRSLANAWLVK